MIEHSSFTSNLIRWYSATKRDLPWRSTKDPFPIWLSEIILQQTRVDQGLPYWENFMIRFPTVYELANASEEEVLRLWQGLGYYSRARNLHGTAKDIVKFHNGSFPDSYEELLKLRGIGPYTAAAISSICFDETRPVVDGNVFRFAARYFNIEDDISAPRTRKIFESKLSVIIDKKSPGTFNQAMMEFGATVCTPSPNCSDCIFSLECLAFRGNKQGVLPVKIKKTKTKERVIHYLAFTDGTNYILRKRAEGDIWTNMYDFISLEGKQTEEDIVAQIKSLYLSSTITVQEVYGPIIHILSHQKIKATFYLLMLRPEEMTKIAEGPSLNVYNVEELLNLPKPKLIVNFLSQHGIIS